MEQDQKIAPNVMKKPKRSHKLWWILLGAILIIVIVGFVLYQTGVLGGVFRSKDIVARVGNHNITKQEIQKVKDGQIAAGFYGDSDEKIKKLVMDYWLYSLAAKEYGIEANDSQVLDIIKNKSKFIQPAPILDINNSYVRYRGYLDYYQQRIQTIIDSPAKGSYVLAHFDQNFARETPILKAMSDEEYEALLKADKDYATNFINDIYTKIKSGEITFEQGMELQKNNKVIGKTALSTAVQSANFGQMTNAPENSGSIAKNPQIKARIDELKPGEISQPFIVKVPKIFTKPDELVDGFWVIVKVDSKSSGPKFDTINAALESFKKKYGYEVFN